jgi:hypothetical protein
MKHIRLFEEIAHNNVDPLGEEKWEDDKDSIYYGISTGFEGYDGFVLKLEKVYVYDMKPSYHNRTMTQGFENHYDVEFMGGLKRGITVFKKKLTFEDITYPRVVNTRTKLKNIVMKHASFLIQEKYMTEQEILDLTRRLFDNGIKNEIDRQKRIIAEHDRTIKRMEEGTGLKIDLEMKGIRPPDRNINFG